MILGADYMVKGWSGYQDRYQLSIIRKICIRGVDFFEINFDF